MAENIKNTSISRKDYHASYYKKNREKIRKQQRSYQLLHQKELNEYNKDYYHKNKSRIIYNRYKNATLEFIESRANKKDLIELKNKIDQLIKNKQSGYER